MLAGSQQAERVHRRSLAWRAAAAVACNVNNSMRSLAQYFKHHFGRSRVPGDVRQRFLNDPEHSCGAVVVEIDVVCNAMRDAHAMLLRKPVDEPFEGWNQAMRLTDTTS
ncbi:hypothetical protein QF000_000503 [Paraburkholderia atlantica]|uniref:hypothetical protein n=1 Tax=Paraburkholderia atlantica TaxID=2654982 RepID=UPI003D1EE514